MTAEGPARRAARGHARPHKATQGREGPRKAARDHKAAHKVVTMQGGVFGAVAPAFRVLLISNIGPHTTRNPH